MTAPRPRSHEATRDRILSAAATALAEHGFAEARLSEIARIAEIKPPAIYYYFDSRIELLTEVLRSGQQQVREHVTEELGRLPTDASHALRIETACASHLSIQFAMADFARAVTRNATHVTGPFHEELRQEGRAYHDLWRKILDDAAEDGSLQPGLDPNTARMFVIGALNWTTEWFTSESDVNHLIEQARWMVRNALLAHG